MVSAGFFILQIYFADKDNFSIDLKTILKSLIPTSCFAVAVYINIYYLIPRFLKPKNYIFYGFWLIVVMAAASVLIQVMFLYPFNSIFTGINKPTTFDLQLYSRYFFVTLIYVGITSFLKFVK
jgi:hypothetical protein